MKSFIFAVTFAAISSSAFADTNTSSAWKVDVCGTLNPKDIYGDITLSLKDGTKYFVSPASPEAHAVAEQLIVSSTYNACVRSLEEPVQGYEGMGIFAQEIQLKGEASGALKCGTFAIGYYHDVTLTSEGKEYMLVSSKDSVRAELEALRPSLQEGTLSGCVRNYRVNQGYEGVVLDIGSFEIR